MISALKDIVTLVVGQRRQLQEAPKPGDLVRLTSGAHGAFTPTPMTMPHPDIQLEREAFTGRAGAVVTGWLTDTDLALVVSVRGDYSYLKTAASHGWINNEWLVQA